MNAVDPRKLSLFQNTDEVPDAPLIPAPVLLSEEEEVYESFHDAAVLQVTDQETVTITEKSFPLHEMVTEYQRWYETVISDEQVKIEEAKPVPSGDIIPEQERSSFETFEVEEAPVSPSAWGKITTIFGSKKK